jgi:hypothetical protein
MLTSRGTRTEIQNFLDFLVISEIALYANPAVDRNGTVSSFSNLSNSPFLLSHGHPSVLDYRHWIAGGLYSALLFDGALLQFSYRYANGVLVGHRLGYVPCPYNPCADDLLYRDVIDILELFDKCDPSEIVLAAAIRFDFDSAAAKSGHPAAHMTMNAASCRIPCAAPLRLGQFVEFIFGHFYPDHWAGQPYLRNLPKSDWAAKTVTDEESRGVHFSWRA